MGLLLRPSATDIASVVREALDRGLCGVLDLPGASVPERRLLVQWGEIVAATAPDDGPAILRRLTNHGAITERQSASFSRSLERGARTDDVLLGHVPTSLLQQVLYARHQQNLLDFIAAESAPAFTAQDVAFADNLQIGRDGCAALEATLARESRVAPLRARRNRLTLRPGSAMPARQDEARLLDLADPVIPLAELLAYSPFEEGETLDLVRAMLESGAMVCDEGLRPVLARMPGPAAGVDPDFAEETLFDAGGAPGPAAPARGALSAGAVFAAHAWDPAPPQPFVLPPQGDDAPADDWGDDAPPGYVPFVPGLAGPPEISMLPLAESALEPLISLAPAEDGTRSPGPAADAGLPAPALAAADLAASLDSADSPAPVASSAVSPPARPARTPFDAPTAPLAVLAPPVAVPDPASAVAPAVAPAPAAAPAPVLPAEDPPPPPPWEEEDLFRYVPVAAPPRPTPPPAAAPPAAAPPAEAAPPLIAEVEPLPFSETPVDSLLAEALRSAGEAAARRRRAHADGGEDGDGSRGFRPRADLFGLGADLSDAELAMFADHDVVRGSGAGHFVVGDSLLDKVDLAGDDAEDAPLRPGGAAPEDLRDALPPGLFPEPADLIEVDDAEGVELGAADKVVTITFAAPPMRPEEALHKLEVCADVLARVSRALDRAQGPGAGQACVQLLLDGAPIAYLPLLHGLEATPQGRFSPPAALANLQRQPKAEHRRLVDRGIMDLIERALSYAVEEMSDADMDALLEEIAGYQQRLRG